jgi:hypothetical protein
MTSTQSTRRLEMALPLIAPIAQMMEARAKVKAGDASAMPMVMERLGSAGVARSVRKLSAIFSANDNELEQAEKDPAYLAKMEATAAGRPFAETFGEAMELFGYALGLAGVTPGYFADAPADPAGATGTKTLATEPDSPSAD